MIDRAEDANSEPQHGRQQSEPQDDDADAVEPRMSDKVEIEQGEGRGSKERRDDKPEGAKPEGEAEEVLV